MKSFSILGIGASAFCITIGCTDIFSQTSESDGQLAQSTAPNDQIRENNSQDCGNTVLEGYLISYNATVSAALRIENLSSKTGLSCNVDICVSTEDLPSTSDTSCENEKRTSACYLEKIGFIDTVENPVPDTVWTVLIGNMEDASVCSPFEKCETQSASCVVCKDEKIFVPCAYRAK